MNKSAKLKKINQEIIVGLVLLAYFLMITLAALNFPEEARLFPLVLGIPATFLSAFVLFIAYRKQRLARTEFQSAEGEEDDDRSDALPASFEMRRELVAFGFGILYLLLVYLFGFMISTFLLSIVTPYFLGMRRPLPIVTFALILLLIVWLVFPVALGLSLPTGLLGLI